MVQRGLLLRGKKLLEEAIGANNYCLKDISRDLVPLLESQWKKANLSFVPPVTIGHRALEQKIETLWKKVQDAAYGRG